MDLTSIITSIGPTNSQMTMEEGSSTANQQLEKHGLTHNTTLALVVITPYFLSEP